MAIDLARLAQLAADDRADRFGRRPRWQPYADRLICTAFCQGAAQHYVDGTTGVKDFDVYSFYAEDPALGQFPPRWRTTADFGPSRFGRRESEPDGVYVGRRVDLCARSLDIPLGTDPVKVMHGYLTRPRTATAHHLAKKAVVLLDPKPLRGKVVWPLGAR